MSIHQDDGSLFRTNLYSANVSSVINGPAMADDPLRTYIVTGNGRGGTTMVAGVVQALGLELNTKGATNLEDPDIVRLGHGLDPKDVRTKLNITPAEMRTRLNAIVAQRNRENAIWGWKDPSADNYVYDILPALRNLNLIVVFRDPAAIATAMMAVNFTEPDVAIRKVLEHYSNLMQLIAKLKRPTLVISYERSRQKPELLAQDLAAFTGLTLTPEKLAAIQSYVSPTGGYVHKANVVPAVLARTQAEAASLYQALQQTQAEAVANYAALQRVQAEAVTNYEAFQKAQAEAVANYDALQQVRAELTALKEQQADY